MIGLSSLPLSVNEFLRQTCVKLSRRSDMPHVKGWDQPNLKGYGFLTFSIQWVYRFYHRAGRETLEVGSLQSFDTVDL